MTSLRANLRVLTDPLSCSLIRLPNLGSPLLVRGFCGLLLLTVKLRIVRILSAGQITGGKMRNEERIV